MQIQRCRGSSIALRIWQLLFVHASCRPYRIDTLLWSHLNARLNATHTLHPTNIKPNNFPTPIANPSLALFHTRSTRGDTKIDFTAFSMLQYEKKTLLTINPLITHDKPLIIKRGFNKLGVDTAIDTVDLRLEVTWS